MDIDILNYLLGILLSRSHVPGKQPGSAHLSFTIDHDANFCQACGTSTEDGGPVGARHAGRQQLFRGVQILLELHALSEAKVVPGAAVVKFPRLSFTPEVHTLCYHRGDR